MQADGVPLRVHRVRVARAGARGGLARGAVRPPRQVGGRRAGRAGRARQAMQGGQRRLQPGAGPALLRKNYI